MTITPHSYSTNTTVFTVTNASSYFLYYYAELGSARWYELDANLRPSRICLSQGYTIYRRAFSIFRELSNPNDDTRIFRTLNVDDGLSAAWFPALLAFVQRFVVHSTPTANEQLLLQVLSENPDNWAEENMQRNFGLITLLFIWVAFYQQPLSFTGMTDPSGPLFPLARLGLPPNTAPFDFSTDTANPFPAGVQIPERPVCYDANVSLRTPTNNPNLPMPTPQGASHEGGTPLRLQATKKSGLFGVFVTILSLGGSGYFVYKK